MNKSGLSSFGLSHPFQADAAAGAQFEPDFDQLDAGELVKQLTFARSNKPDFPAGFVDRLQPVGLRLVRPEDAEVAHVQPHDFPEEVAEGGDVPPRVAPSFLTATAELRKSGRSRALRSKPPFAIGMALIRRHPLGGKVLQLRNQLPLLVEEFLGVNSRASRFRAV